MLAIEMLGESENNIGKTEKQTVKFVGRLVFSDSVFSRNASGTFFKFPIEGLNDGNQQYNAKTSFTNNLIKFSKEKN